MASLKEYFRFNRAERMGTVILLVLIVLIMTATKVYVYYHQADPLSEAAIEDSIKKYYGEKSLIPVDKKDSLFYFNPNHLTFKQGQQLGLRDNQIRMMLNYLNKGGQFKHAADLKKIYALTTKDVERLMPYVRIDTKLAKQQLAKSINKRIEINAADSLTLVGVKGIGPVFASRIIRYRKMLGGFYSLKQLSEVYGMDKGKQELMTACLFVDSSRIERLTLNKATFKELVRHPYIGYENAKKIMNYRNREGRFHLTAELISNNLLDVDTYHKVMPYIAL